MQVRNSITLIGNLGNDPKSTTLPSGTLATEFSLATNDYYRDREGNRQTRTEWHRVKAYGKLAELFSQYLEQGAQVAIVGSMRYNKWIDKYDQTRITAEVVADSFTFLSPGKTQEAAEQEATLVAEPEPAKPARKRTKRSAAKKANPTAATPAEGDDLPF
jgi:single-strand DNA-binding protein